MAEPSLGIIVRKPGELPADRSLGPYHLEPLVRRDEEGALTAWHVRLDPGAVTPASYHLVAEEAYFVLEGRLTARWEEGGRRCEQRLGPRDLLLTPPGQPHAFRNEGPGTAQFMMVVGTPGVEDVEFRAA